MKWKCDTCGRDIGPQESGAVYLTKGARAAANEATRIYDQITHDRVANGGWLKVDSKLLLSAPTGEWRVDCPEHVVEDGGSYWVDTRDLCDARSVLSWTFHLMGKYWLEGTDWESFIETRLPR